MHESLSALPEYLLLLSEVLIEVSLVFLDLFPKSLVLHKGMRVINQGQDIVIGSFPERFRASRPFRGDRRLLQQRQVFPSEEGRVLRGGRTAA